MTAGQMTEFTSVMNWIDENGSYGGVFASISYDNVNIYIKTTGAPEFYFNIFPSGVAPTSWSNFAVVVGFHK